jgi:hypothetical protein
LSFFFVTGGTFSAISASQAVKASLGDIWPLIIFQDNGRTGKESANPVEKQILCNILTLEKIENAFFSTHCYNLLDFCNC